MHLVGRLLQLELLLHPEREGLRIRRTRSGQRHLELALRDPKTSCGEYLLGELMKLCKDNLSLAERPDEIKCVKIIPRNAMGKVLKKQLKASG